MVIEKAVIFAEPGRKFDDGSQDLLENTRPHRFWNRKQKKLWILMIFITGALLYASRTAMPVCAVSVAHEFNLTKTQTGMVLSSFFWGYVTTQIIGGVMADKYGGEYTIAYSLAGWSTMTFLTPFVVRWVDQSRALHYAIIMRFLTGCCQGFFFPSISSLFSKRVPDSERAFSYSFACSGSHIGTMFSGIVGSLLNDYVGWHYTFITIGVLSFILFVIFHSVIIGTCYHKYKVSKVGTKYGHARESKRYCRETQDSEYRYDKEEGKSYYKEVDGRVDDKSSIKIVVGDSDDCDYERLNKHFENDNVNNYSNHNNHNNHSSHNNHNNHRNDANKPSLVHKSSHFAWCILFTKVPFWALLIASFCSGWQFFIMLSWLSTYFRETFPDSSSWVFNTIPWLFGPPSQWLSGWMADNLTRKGYSTSFVRKFIQSLAFLGSAFCLLLMTHTQSYYSALLFMTLAIGFSCFHFSGISVLVQDIAPSCAGVAYGIQNMAGSAPGFIGVYIVGYILEVSESWTFVFDLNCAILLFGWVVFTIFGTGKKIV